MMWLHLILLVQLIGFQYPIVQAAYRVDDYSESSQKYYGNYRPTANSRRRETPPDPEPDDTKESEDHYHHDEDVRKISTTVDSTYREDENVNAVFIRLMPPDKYSRNAPGRSNEKSEHPIQKLQQLGSSKNTSKDSGKKPQPPKPQPHDIIIPQPLVFSALGVAIIYSHEGIICSGVHLKPWILLTVADCVHRKHPEDLYAQIIKREGKNSPPVTFHVNVIFHEIHPEYRYSNSKSHNLAIVGLKAGHDWNVDAFSIPKEPKGKDFNPEKLLTYVNEWDELRTPHNMSYFLSIEKKFASTNFNACNGQKPQNGFFCVSDGSNHDIYEQIDVGIPLFYRVGASKVLLGLYTGEDLNNGVLGHMFLNIYDNLFWVSEKLFENPLPPIV